MFIWTEHSQLSISVSVHLVLSFHAHLVADLISSSFMKAMDFLCQRLIQNQCTVTTKRLWLYRLRAQQWIRISLWLISDMLYINKPIPTDAEADLGKEEERVMSVCK